ncbi:chaperone DnaJ-domain superfamily protein [Artemisia annua]|uniref:Chaperone DnaJ-domain superfamily protein n=1 Tax=Artemisia annua TaxID=35608 RepID=A0A2U1LN63_ARTAN|nr:chaperone DnaJ-domain superfamily protein [Artemisia annua]
MTSSSVNKYAFADEALSSLFSAWNVLSNRVKKMEFDEKLRKAVKDGEDEKVFWTVCPYCWYVYEYDRVYLGVFMRCCNEKCGRAFTCVEIDKPPEEVLSEGGGNGRVMREEFMNREEEEEEETDVFGEDVNRG